MAEADVKNKISGDFEWKLPAIIPSFVQGEDARAIYDIVHSTLGRGTYDEASRTLIGSNVPLAARIDTIVRPLGMRVATLTYLSRPEVMEMIKDKHYSDTPALVLRSNQDSYSPNRQIIAQILPSVEQKQGKLKLPVMITGCA